MGHMPLECDAARGWDKGGAGAPVMPEPMRLHKLSQISRALPKE